MEGRLLLATITVNTTADDSTLDSTLSLREAIEVANGTLSLAVLSPQERAQVSGPLTSPAPDTIAFDIPGTGPHTINISPTSALPPLMITDPVIINGTSQPGFTGTPIIELHGPGSSMIGPEDHGLEIDVSMCTVQGLVINNFGGSGIYISSGSNDIIRGNYIGTNATLTAVLPNTRDGVTVDFAATTGPKGTKNTIADNVILGNGASGVFVSQYSSDNTIKGNRIGTNATGTPGLGNGGAGVSVDGTNNMIEDNTIVNNGITGVPSTPGAEGIFIHKDNNKVLRNFIGTDAAGTTGLGNGAEGIKLLSDSTSSASYNTIAGNIISDNGVSPRGGPENAHSSGITVEGPATHGNVIQGNFIGTDATGTKELPNISDGVIVLNGASANTIGGTAAGAGNVISGNGTNGIELRDSGTTGTIVQGNRIGTDVTGTTALGNGSHGILISQTAGTTNPSSSGNTIGGTTAAARNVIAGNKGNGIEIFAPNGGGSGNLIQGNFIGTDVTGTKALSNSIDGVWIDGGPDNTVGGTAAGAGNVISGNGTYGIELLNSGTTGTVVQGNLIGTDVTGTTALGNGSHGILISQTAGTTNPSSSGNTIGGTTAAARNVIAGNKGNGIEIFAPNGGGSGNLIQGNFIGTGVTGTTALGNSTDGVLIDSGPDNTVGGTAAGAGNVISGNGTYGIELLNSGTTRTIVQGNSIKSNRGDGVFLNASSGNMIGGAGPGNIIADNLNVGIQAYDNSNGNLIQANTVTGNGTDGVYINGSSDNTILSNVIAQNSAVLDRGVGVQIFGGTRNCVLSNQIQNNGTDGVFINTSSGNVIGQAGQGNVISGNRRVGVQVFGGKTMVGARNNVVQGNTITDNGLDGVALNSAFGNTVGGNVIMGNRWGVNILGSRATGNSVGNSVLGNVIRRNKGFDVALQSPVIGNVIGGPLGEANNLSKPAAVYAGGRSRNRIGRNMPGHSGAGSVGPHRSTPETGLRQRHKVR